MGKQLEHIITPVDPAELANAIVEAWRSLFGVSPSRETVLILMAQSAHETGRWRATHCFNIGNVKSRLDDGRDFTFFRCRERINGQNVWFDPPHPATRFRAFQSLAEGVIDHLGFLRGSKRYASAWSHLEAGDPRAFVSALKAGGYFTDEEEIYARAVMSFFAQFSLKLPETSFEPPAPEIDDDTRRRTLGLVALSLRDLAGEVVRPDPTMGAVSDTEPAPPPDRDPKA